MQSQTNPKSVLFTMRIIYMAIASGLFFFTAIFFYINKNEQFFSPDLKDPILIASILLAITAIPAGYYISAGYWRKSDPESPLMTRLMRFQTGLIIRLASCEGVGLFSLVGFFLSGNLFFIIVLGVSLICILSNYPSPVKIGNSTKLSESELYSLTGQ